MDPQLFDCLITPILAPTIMGISSYKLFKTDQRDLLYTTIAFGTILSSVYSLIQSRVNRHFRSRTQLTFLTSILMTTTSLASIIGFNVMRINSRPIAYALPFAIRHLVSTTDGYSVLKYHIFADFIPALIIVSQSQLCSMMTHDLVNKAKRRFSFGEASVIAQLFSACYLTWAFSTYSKLTGAGPFQVNLTTDLVLDCGFILFAIVFLPAYLFLKGRSSIIRYGMIGAVGASCYFRIQNLLAPTSTLEPLTWFVDYIFTTHQRISLFSLWLSTITACISFSVSWSKMVGRTNDLMRKVFHLAICVVFISGYNQDIDFTRFAGGGIVLVLFLLEIVRIWQLPPIGTQLERVYSSLRGKWDNKFLTLSHIYLLLGSFIPLWLLPNNPALTTKLAVSTGIISVGVGDAAAAVVGTFYGKTRISSKSGKTLEGLMGNIVAMFIFKIVWIGYSGFLGEFSFLISAMVTAAVEATTETCDNLVLPLVMILSLEILSI